MTRREFKSKSSESIDTEMSSFHSESLSPSRGIRLLLVLLALLKHSVAAFPTCGGSCALTPKPSNQSRGPSAMFVMGDSSVDCGDNTLFYSLVHRNRSIYPCNGSDSATLVPYILAEKMRLPKMQPFYSLDGSVSSLLRGINFGSAQATIMNTGRSDLQSLNQQLRQVMDTFQLLQLHLGQEASKNLIRSFIFFTSFGKDDYTDIFLRNSSGIMLKGGAVFAHILVTQMIHALRDLYQADVRKIVVMGILPLGCTPRMMWHWRNVTRREWGCVEEVNALVVAYNNLLENSVAEFRTKYPDAGIVFCDVYRVVLDIISRPVIHGFEDVKTACCGLGWHGAMIGCLSLETTCNRSSTHVWWDFYNPTFAVNSLLADSAWSGNPIPNICRPFSIHELMSA
ncbi:unnamed protein product [Rhodiola kirilowii]